MTRRDRIGLLLAVLLFIGLAKAGQQIYRWQAFAAERVEIGRLEVVLESSAVGVIRTQMTADTLRREIEAADEELGAALGRVNRMERGAAGGSIGRGQEMAYRRGLREYNEKVGRRNELVRRWRDTLEANHMHVDGYNSVADSIRVLAERMGEPYYPIRTPAEIAVAHGVLSGEG